MRGLGSLILRYKRLRRTWERETCAAIQRRRETSVTAGLALGVPLVFGCGVGLAMISFGPGWVGPRGAPWQTVLGIGMACAVTALPILVLFLEKLEFLRQPIGQRILRCASLDDLAIWGVLAIVLLCVMPVFFMSTGLRTGWSVGGVAVFSAAAALLVASVGGKLAGMNLAGRILGWEGGEASLIGSLLQTKALIMIILVNILLEKGVITSATFTATLLMAVGCTMLSIPMAAPLLRRHREIIFKPG